MLGLELTQDWFGFLVDYSSILRSFPVLSLVVPFALNSVLTHTDAVVLA